MSSGRPGELHTVGYACITRWCAPRGWFSHHADYVTARGVVRQRSSPGVPFPTEINFSCPGMCCLPLDVSSCFGLAPCLDPREGLVCCDSGVGSRPYVAADLRLAHQPYRPLGASHLNGRVSRGPWGWLGGNVGRRTWGSPDTGMTLNYRATYPWCGPAFGPPPPPPPGWRGPLRSGKV